MAVPWRRTKVAERTLVERSQLSASEGNRGQHPEVLPVPEQPESQASSSVTATLGQRPAQPTAGVDSVNLTGSLGVVTKTAELQQIEQILQQDLDGLYQAMPPMKQQLFRQRGELLAQKIERLLQVATTQVQQLVKLIADWLRLIPGVNRFFVAQSAHIKAGQLLAIKKP